MSDHRSSTKQLQRRTAQGRRRARAQAAGLLGIDSERVGGTHRLRLAGELDVHTATQLDDELARVEAGDADAIVVDLGELEFIDSAGLQAFIRATARARHHNKRLTLLPAGEHVHRIFEITGLVARLPFADTDRGPR